MVNHIEILKRLRKSLVKITKGVILMNNYILKKEKELKGHPCVKFIFEQVQDPEIRVLLVDQEGVVIDASSPVLQMMGGRDNIVGEKFGANHPGFTPVIIEALNKKEIIKKVKKHTNGKSIKFIDVTAIPLFNNQDLIGGIAIGINVTERITKYYQKTILSLKDEMEESYLCNRDITNSLKISRIIDKLVLHVQKSKIPFND